MSNRFWPAATVLMTRAALVRIVARPFRTIRSRSRSSICRTTAGACASASAKVSEGLLAVAAGMYQDNQLTVWLWHGQSITGLQSYVRDYDMQWHGRVIGFAKAWLNK